MFFFWCFTELLLLETVSSEWEELGYICFQNIARYIYLSQTYIILYHSGALIIFLAMSWSAPKITVHGQYQFCLDITHLCVLVSGILFSHMLLVGNASGDVCIFFKYVFTNLAT